METADNAETSEKGIDSTKLQSLLERKEKYEAYKKQLDESGENELSVVDPDARLMGNNRSGVDVAYNVQCAVDGKYDIVVGFDVSTNPSDHHQLGTMAKKVKRLLKVRRFTALADKGYYNGEDMRRLKKMKVTAIVAKQKPSHFKDLPEMYHPDRFIYNEQTDTIACPLGHILNSPTKKDAARRSYFNKAACAGCPGRTGCVTGKAGFRTVTRSCYSKTYEYADRLFNENKELYKRRQEIVEHPFGTIKHSMDGRYFLLRTRRKVRAEIALLFLGYNLKRAVNVLGFDGIMARMDAIRINFIRLFSYISLMKGFLAIGHA
jgi:hypothetical protein